MNEATTTLTRAALHIAFALPAGYSVTNKNVHAPDQAGV